MTDSPGDRRQTLRWFWLQRHRKTGAEAALLQHNSQQSTHVPPALTRLGPHLAGPPAPTQSSSCYFRLRRTSLGRGTATAWGPGTVTEDTKDNVGQPAITLGQRQRAARPFPCPCRAVLWAVRKGGIVRCTSQGIPQRIPGCQLNTHGNPHCDGAQASSGRGTPPARIRLTRAMDSAEMDATSARTRATQCADRSTGSGKGMRGWG